MRDIADSVFDASLEMERVMCVHSQGSAKIKNGIAVLKQLLSLK